MRNLVLCLLLITVSMWIVLKAVTSRTDDPDIEARFIERVDYIPSTITPSAFLSLETLQRWLNDPAKAQVRKSYAVPVLFPLDYFFLVSLGLLLGFSSVALSDRLIFLRSIPHWIWWVFPVLYIVFDLLEDSILIALFSNNLNLDIIVYRLLRFFTQAKIATVSIAIGQSVFLLALCGLLRL
jgi:hypothetical protein